MKYSPLILAVVLLFVGCTPFAVKVRVVIDGTVDAKIVEEFKAHLSSFIMGEQNVIVVDLPSLDEKERERE